MRVHWSSVVCLLLLLFPHVASFWLLEPSQVTRKSSSRGRICENGDAGRQRRRVVLSTTAAAASPRDENDDEPTNNNNDDEPSQSSSSLTELSTAAAKLAQAKTLQQQAQALREEATLMRQSIQETQERKLQKELANIDRWIDQLLVNCTVDENTQMLNTVEQVTRLLQDGRYSAEQVHKIFQRICETSGRLQSRSECSPLVSLLVDAAGKMDCLERQDQPNKRWNGRVERQLRKILFARDWGIEIAQDQDDESTPRGLL